MNLHDLTPALSLLNSLRLATLTRDQEHLSILKRHVELKRIHQQHPQEHAALLCYELYSLQCSLQALEIVRISVEDNPSQ